MWSNVAVKLATGTQLRTAGAAALALAAAIGLTAMIADRPAPETPLAVAAALGFGAALQLASAYLMFGQYRLHRAPAMAALGAGYVFWGVCSVLRIFHLDPERLVSTQIGPNEWLHLLSAAGFAVAAFTYAATCGEGSADDGAAAHRKPWRVALAAAVLAGGCAVALSWADPDWTADQPWRELWRVGVTPAVIGLQSLAIIALLASGRGRDLIQIWLVVALLAAVGDLALVTLGGHRASWGRHAGAAFSILSAGVVLTMLLREMIWLSLHIVELNARLRRQAAIDGMTGIANRRSFDEHLLLEWRRAQRDHTSLALLMVDIDHFKAYNDLYGHVAGDACIRAVAGVVEHFAKRAGDLAARYGGEEFALILPRAAPQAAEALAESLRAAVAALALPHAASAVAPVATVSVGWAALTPGSTQDPRALVAAADAALYEAKRQGRNRIAGSP